MLPTLETREKIDPRAKRTRKLLIDAFQELLEEKGFEEITIQDITGRATVNRATFYAHFADKYALVDEIIREGFAQILRNRLPEGKGLTADYLRALLLAVTDHWLAVNGRCKHTYQMFDSLVETQIKGQLYENIREWLSDEEGIQNGSRKQIDMAATIVSWSIYGAALQWTQVRKTETAEQFAEAAVPVIAASVEALRMKPA